MSASLIFSRSLLVPPAPPHLFPPLLISPLTSLFFAHFAPLPPCSPLTSPSFPFFFTSHLIPHFTHPSLFPRSFRISRSAFRISPNAFRISPSRISPSPPHPFQPFNRRLSPHPPRPFSALSSSLPFSPLLSFQHSPLLPPNIHASPDYINFSFPRSAPNSPPLSPHSPLPFTPYPPDISLCGAADGGRCSRLISPLLFAQLSPPLLPTFISSPYRSPLKSPLLFALFAPRSPLPNPVVNSSPLRSPLISLSPPLPPLPIHSHLILPFPPHPPTPPPFIHSTVVFLPPFFPSSQPPFPSNTHPSFPPTLTPHPINFSPRAVLVSPFRSPLTVFLSPPHPLCLILSRPSLESGASDGGSLAAGKRLSKELNCTDSRSVYHGHEASSLGQQRCQEQQHQEPRPLPIFRRFNHPKLVFQEIQ
ncbi:unnamed protein product [Closterium sp. Naga37s-1]|nr:unnamed protein product [Closterium sp. Naga37s-1]